MKLQHDLDTYTHTRTRREEENLRRDQGDQEKRFILAKVAIQDRTYILMKILKHTHIERKSTYTIYGYETIWGGALNS